MRLLLWSLFDSATTVDELRAKLDPLEEPSRWLWNGAAERFGAIVDGDDDEALAALASARELIGREPDVYEEFDSF